MHYFNERQGYTQTTPPHPSKKLAIPASQSEKKVIEHSAERCSTSVKAIMNLGLNEVADIGGLVPKPDVYKNLLGLASKMREATETSLGSKLGTNLLNFETKLTIWRAQLSGVRRDRESLLSASEEEPLTQTIWVCLERCESERLEEEAKRQGASPATLLREGLFQRLSEHRKWKMKRLEGRVSQWCKRIEMIRKRAKSNRDHGDWIWEQMEKIADRITRSARKIRP